MDFRSTSSRHGAGSRAFHWLVAILVLATYVVTKGDRYSLYSSDADGIRRIHETLGVLVFVVVVMQLLWRLIDRVPAKQPMQRWIAVAARLVRLVLFTLLIAIPATAVLGTWLVGLPMTLLGFDIAPKIARAHELGQRIMEMHTVLGNALLWQRADMRQQGFSTISFSATTYCDQWRLVNNRYSSGTNLTHIKSNRIAEASRPGPHPVRCRQAWNVGS